MEKFKAWLRRHKTKFLDFGILLGLTLLAWAYINAPLNINRMTVADWQDTHIAGIGVVTIQKISANAPYSDIRDVEKIDGVGKQKSEQIERYFTTWDTARANKWWAALIAGTVFFFGCVTGRVIHETDRIIHIRHFEKSVFGKEKDVKR